MRWHNALAMILVTVLVLSGCTAAPLEQPVDAVQILLDDEAVTVDGVVAGNDSSSSVYTARDIIYYETGKDFTYGEGETADAHTAEEAAAHAVVHIAEPGVYALSGKLSKGQIAVDLGEDAKKDPNAVVTLILDSVDITCEVAPAVIFYNVYECGSDEDPTKDVDTSAAGANVIIADGSENTVNGAYVARIYDPESVQLSEDGTKVEDAKKLHKYDGAFYSKMSMNITGGQKNTGVLNIYAANEGLDSEMHLTLNGGNVNIFSGNDGINTNEDGVSVTTINGGNLTIQVTGETGEGDGIDSNGWLVINGGTVIASACARSADAGIDSDMGIHINGGIVIAGGSMLDRIEAGGQNYAVFSFAQRQAGNLPLQLKCEDGKVLAELEPGNDYSILVYSSPDLNEGNYTLWNGEQQLAGSAGGMGGRPGVPGGFPGGGERPERPEDEGQMPHEGWTPPEGVTPPEGTERPEKPEGEGNKLEGGFRPGENNAAGGEATTQFTIINGGNQFNAITAAS